jgi:hypothetical protein
VINRSNAGYNAAFDLLINQGVGNEEEKGEEKETEGGGS